MKERVKQSVYRPSHHMDGDEDSHCEGKRGQTVSTRGGQTKACMWPDELFNLARQACTIISPKTRLGRLSARLEKEGGVKYHLALCHPSLIEQFTGSLTYFLCQLSIKPVF